MVTVTIRLRTNDAARLRTLADARGQSLPVLCRELIFSGVHAEWLAGTLYSRTDEKEDDDIPEPE